MNAFACVSINVCLKTCNESIASILHTCSDDGLDLVDQVQLTDFDEDVSDVVDTENSPHFIGLYINSGP